MGGLVTWIGGLRSHVVLGCVAELGGEYSPVVAISGYKPEGDVCVCALSRLENVERLSSVGRYTRVRCVRYHQNSCA